MVHVLLNSKRKLLLKYKIFVIPLNTTVLSPEKNVMHYK